MDQSDSRPLRTLTPKELNMRETSVLLSSGRPRLFGTRLGGLKTAPPPKRSSSPASRPAGVSLNLPKKSSARKNPRTSSGSLPTQRNLNTVFRAESPPPTRSTENQQVPSRPTTPVKATISPRSAYSTPQYTSPVHGASPPNECIPIPERRSISAIPSDGEREGLRRPYIRAPPSRSIFSGGELTPRSIKAAQKIKREAEKVVRLEQQKREMIILAQENSQEVIKSLSNHSSLVESELARKSKDAARLRAEKMMAEANVEKLRLEISERAQALETRDQAIRDLRQNIETIQSELNKERSERAAETFQLETRIMQRSEELTNLRVELRSMRDTRQHIELMLKEVQDEAGHETTKSASLQAQCDDLARQLSQKTEEIQGANTRVFQLQVELDQTLADLQRRAEEDRAVQTEKERLTSERRILEDQKNKLEERVTEIESVRETLRKTNESLCEQLQSKEADVCVFEKSVSGLKAQQIRSAEEMARLQQLVRDYQTQLTERESRLTEVEWSKNELKDQNAVLDNSLLESNSQIVSLQDRVALSAAEVGDKRDAMARLSQHESRLEDEVNLLTEANRKADEEKGTLIGRLGCVESELKEQMTLRASQAAMIQSLKEELRLVSHEVERVTEQARLDAATSETLRTELAASQQNTTDIGEKLDEALDKLGAVEAEMQKVSARARAAEDELSKVDRMGSPGERSFPVEDVADILALENELDDARQEIEGLSEEMTDLQFTCDSLTTQRNTAYRKNTELEDAICELKKEKKEQDEFLTEAKKAEEILVRQLSEAALREKVQQEKLRETQLSMSVSKEELAAMELQHGQLVDALAGKDREAAKLRASLKDAEEARDRVEDELAKMDELEEEHDRMVENLREAEDQLIQRTEEVDNISSRLIETDKELVTARNSIVDLQAQADGRPEQLATPVRSRPPKTPEMKTGEYTPVSFSPSPADRNLANFSRMEEEVLGDHIVDLRSTVTALESTGALEKRIRELELANQRLSFELKESSEENRAIRAQMKNFQIGANDCPSANRRGLHEVEAERMRFRTLGSHP